MTGSEHLKELVLSILRVTRLLICILDGIAQADLTVSRPKTDLGDSTGGADQVPDVRHGRAGRALGVLVAFRRLR